MGAVELSQACAFSESVGSVACTPADSLLASAGLSRRNCLYRLDELSKKGLAQMIDKTFKRLGMTAAMAAAMAVGCGDDGSPATSANNNNTGGVATDTNVTTDTPTTSTPTDTDASGSGTTGGPDACLGIGGPAADGEACAVNADCMSGVCFTVTDRPADANAVCEAAAADCSTRVIGTLWDFSAVVDTGTPAPLAGVSLSVLGAISALSGIADAEPLVKGDSDANGLIDIVSDGPLSEAIAIIGVTGGGDLAFTATGLASVQGTMYNVAADNHEFWAIPNALLDTWSTELGNDAGITAEMLPLGGMPGGIVGFVRDVDGVPVEGATVVPASADSGAIVRFPQDDGTMSADMTGPSGVYIVLGGASTGEDYDAAGGGASGSGRAGNAGGAVFALILNVQ